MALASYDLVFSLHCGIKKIPNNSSYFMKTQVCKWNFMIGGEILLGVARSHSL